MLKLNLKSWILITITAISFVIVFAYQLYWMNFSERHLQRGLENKVSQIIENLKQTKINHDPHNMLTGAFDSLRINYEYKITNSKIEVISSGYDKTYAGKSFDITFGGSNATVYFPQRQYLLFQSPWKFQIFALISLFLIVGAFALIIYLLIRQLKLSNQQRNFVNNITHEFKTPISTIKIAHSALQEDNIITDPQQREYFIRQISESNTRLNQLVDQVLNLASAESLSHLTKKPEVINELVDEALQLLQPIIEKHGKFSVKQSITKNVKPVICNKLHLTSAFKNIIENSLKHSQSGDATITIDVIQDAETTQIRFEDNGGGIHTSVDVTKPFQQSDFTKSGFGLGLSYVKEVCKQHNGSLELMNKEKGLLVSITIKNL